MDNNNTAADAEFARRGMKQLANDNDPTGFFQYLQAVAMTRYGNPNGIIETRGQWPSFTTKGPGSSHGGKQQPTGSKLQKKFFPKEMDIPVTVHGDWTSEEAA